MISTEVCWASMLEEYQTSAYGASTDHLTFLEIFPPKKVNMNLSWLKKIFKQLTERNQFEVKQKKPPKGHETHPQILFRIAVLSGINDRLGAVLDSQPLDDVMHVRVNRIHLQAG